MTVNSRCDTSSGNLICFHRSACSVQSLVISSNPTETQMFEARWKSKITGVTGKKERRNEPGSHRIHSDMSQEEVEANLRETLSDPEREMDLPAHDKLISPANRRRNSMIHNLGWQRSTTFLRGLEQRQHPTLLAYDTKYIITARNYNTDYSRSWG